MFAEETEYTMKRFPVFKILFSWCWQMSGKKEVMIVFFFFQCRSQKDRLPWRYVKQLLQLLPKRLGCLDGWCPFETTFYVCIKVTLKRELSSPASSVYSQVLTTNIKVATSSPTVGNKFSICIYSLSTRFSQVDGSHTNEIKHGIHPR